jgi:hypothetical protein
MSDELIQEDKVVSLMSDLNKSKGCSFIQNKLYASKQQSFNG